MDKFFFPNAPMAQISATLNHLKIQTKFLRQKIKEEIQKFDLIIAQGNRPDRLHVQLHENGLISKFDYFFTGSSFGFEDMSHNWIEREVEENLQEQTPYIWDSLLMWSKFWELLEANRDKKILLISSAPRKEHSRLRSFPNITFASPTADVAAPFEFDKRIMKSIYQSFGVQYDAIEYESSISVTYGYEYHALMLDTQNLVVQATQGSGGVTAKSSKPALFFVSNNLEFQNAIAALRDEGPLRIMPKYEGIGSNTGALALPFGTFISGIPTIKPCHGITELGTKPGTSPGNQWDATRFPSWAIDSEFEQLQMVGNYMSQNGYAGTFGLDPVMPISGENTQVFNSEINSRAQGPDSQRAFAVNRIGICSLEEIQLAFYLGINTDIFHYSEEYNLVTRWLRIPPYLKLFAKNRQTVKFDLNGYWYSQDKGLNKCSMEEAKFKISGAPKPGQVIYQESPDNILYIKFFDPNFQIFNDDIEPGLTPQALEIVEWIYANI